MNMFGLTGNSDEIFVIIHSHFSQRKLAEQQIELLSWLDPLTGLANRRHLMQFLPSEWQRNRRAQTPISLILLDNDDFKKINDQHGQVVGDGCLKQIAGLVARSARRPSDLAVCSGGTRNSCPCFADKAFSAANELLVNARNIKCPDRVRCTISLGVCTAMPIGDDSQSLIQQADTSLYQVKAAGKNQGHGHAPEAHCGRCGNTEYIFHV